MGRRNTNEEPIVGAERTCGQAPENEARSVVAAGDVPAREQLLAVIGIQAEVAKLGLGRGGVLKLMSRQPGRFTEADAKQLLALLSEVVAAAMFFATRYGSDVLCHLAPHDGLTGLANRALFMDRLRNAICAGRGARRAHRDARACSAERTSQGLQKAQHFSAYK